MVASCSMGAEYASRRNGAGLEDFVRDLIVMAPSHVTDFQIIVWSRTAARVAGCLGCLVEARVQTVQDAQPHRKDVRVRDAAECRRWLMEQVAGKHERTATTVPGHAGR
jgi:hypothetical protein